MKLAHTVNYTPLTHCSCLGKRTLIRNMRPPLGCSPSFHHTLCRPGELHRNERLVSASLMALELVPPTLLGLCVCWLGARAGAGGERQKYSQEGGSWCGNWARRKVCFFKITLCWCGLTSISFRHYTPYWAWILKQDMAEVTSLSFQFYTHDKNINNKYCDLQSVNIQSILHGTQWLCIAGAQHFPFSLPRAFPI